MDVSISKTMYDEELVSGSTFLPLKFSSINLKISDVNFFDVLNILI